MRHIGTLDNEEKARKFVAYLITEEVSAKFEQDSTGWDIWVRDEDQLDRAVEELERFLADPDNAFYENVEEQADALFREEMRQREQAQKNVVEMRGKWGKSGGARRAPLVFALIALSVAATIWTNFGKNRENFDYLSFCSAYQKVGWDDDSLNNTLINIRQGQVWRLVTPIFVHLSFIHLLFNMYWTYYLGSQIEDRRGTRRLLLMVLTVACISNVAQAGIESPWFGGMSGVGYGLFGYVWMKSTYDRGSGIFVTQGTILIFLVWFFFCLSGFAGPVANTAHGAGLVVGVVIGYFPVFLRSINRS